MCTDWGTGVFYIGSKDKKNENFPKKCLYFQNFKSGPIFLFHI